MLDLIKGNKIMAQAFPHLVKCNSRHILFFKNRFTILPEIQDESVILRYFDEFIQQFYATN
jgi:hypothetical protein